jgi:hypothetical protein
MRVRPEGAGVNAFAEALSIRFSAGNPAADVFTLAEGMHVPASVCYDT